MARPFEFWRNALHFSSAFSSSISLLRDGEIVEPLQVEFDTGPAMIVAHGNILESQLLDYFGVSLAGAVPVYDDIVVETQTSPGPIRDVLTTTLNNGLVLFSWEQAPYVSYGPPILLNSLYDPISSSVTHVFESRNLGDGMFFSGFDYGGYAVSQLSTTNILEVASVAGALDTYPGGGRRTSREVSFQIFTYSGAVVTSGTANTTTSFDQDDPATTALANGGFVILWTDASQTGADTSGNAVRGRIFSASGTALTSEFLVNTNTAGDQQNAAVAAQPGGGFVAVWQEKSSLGADPGNWGVRAQRFDANGHVIGSQINVNTITGGDQTAPAILSFADGSFLVAWIYNSNWIEGQYFDATGLEVGSEFRIGTTASSQSTLHLSQSSDGRVLATWDTQAGSDGQYLDNRSTLLYGSSEGDAILGHDTGQASINDILVGFAGNDSLYGLAGDDYIYAGLGNDQLYGGLGLDVLLGEAGDDSLFGGTGFNYLFGGDGSDTLYGSEGTAASDVDVMYGDADNDVLYGGIGTNYFYGGSGLDSMYGGSGLNIFISSGEADGDLIYGGSGQNYIYGSNGGDVVLGGADVDVFIMGSGSDNITGGGGVDYAWGGGGSDTFNIDDTNSEVMVIEDFNLGGVNDSLNFAGTSLHSFADVQAAEFYNAAINTTIITDAAGNAAWLIGVGPGQLDASMFKFS